MMQKNFFMIIHILFISYSLFSYNIIKTIKGRWCPKDGCSRIL